TRLRRVVNSAAFASRELRIRSGGFRESPAELDRIVIRLAGAKRAREALRTCFRVEHVPDRRRTAVMQIRGGRPEAVERRGLIAFIRNWQIRGAFAVKFGLGEPGLLVVRPNFSVRPSNRRRSVPMSSIGTILFG